MDAFYNQLLIICLFVAIISCAIFCYREIIRQIDKPSFTEDTTQATQKTTIQPRIKTQCEEGSPNEN